MTEPKTVYNLPLDASVRWSEDQKLLEQTQTFSGDSRIASSLAQTETIAPVQISEFDKFLGLLQRRPSWANFPIFPDFLYAKKEVFRSQIAPFLGTEEQQEALSLRLQNAEGSESDKGRLLKMLEILQHLQEDLIYIVSHCKQYQKG